MRIVLAFLLLSGAYFSFAAAMPAAQWWAWIGWPFAESSKPFLPLSAGLARWLKGSFALLGGSGFLLATAAVFGLLPACWWFGLTAFSAASSSLLYLLYLTRFAITPLAIDAILLWGIFSQHWALPGH